MVRALVALGALAAAALAYADSLSPPVTPSVLPFSRLPPAAPAGQVVYVTDCRAITSVLGLVLTTQPLGAGTGCLATSNGTVWQIDGTTIPVSR